MYVLISKGHTQSTHTWGSGFIGAFPSPTWERWELLLVSTDSRFLYFGQGKLLCELCWSRRWLRGPFVITTSVTVDRNRDIWLVSLQKRHACVLILIVHSGEVQLGGNERAARSGHNRSAAIWLRSQLCPSACFCSIFKAAYQSCLNSVPQVNFTAFGTHAGPKS